MGEKWVRVRYFDASALVKLVADDVDESPGRDAVREYYRGHPSRRATSYCVTEALSAFKLKYLRGRISEPEYIRYVTEFINAVLGANLVIDEIPILQPVVASEAARLIQEHKIDFLDAFQIVTILHGRHQHMRGNSRSLLVTADRDLAKAARREGVQVWECTTETPPD